MKRILLCLLAALLPANNLAGPALFDFAAPAKPMPTANYTAAAAVDQRARQDAMNAVFGGGQS